MRIAMLGSGNIGATLGAALAAAGHDVAYGTRAPGSVDAALDGADVVVLAVPGPAVAALAAPLAGRLVIDATNNMRSGGPLHARAALGDVRYARAFNVYGFENYRDPLPGSSLPFSCPPADRETVERLIADVGLRPEWLGEDAEDILDGVLRLWFALAKHHGRHLALRVLTP